MYDFYDFLATIGHSLPINKVYLAKTTLNLGFLEVWLMTFLRKPYYFFLTMTNLISNKIIKVIVIKEKQPKIKPRLQSPPKPLNTKFNYTLT